MLDTENLQSLIDSGEGYNVEFILLKNVTIRFGEIGISFAS